MIQLIRVDSSWYGLIWVDLDWFRLIPVDTGWYRLIRVDTGWYGLIQVDTSWCRLIRVYTGWYRLIQVDTGWFWLRKANCLREAVCDSVSIRLLKIASHLKKSAGAYLTVLCLFSVCFCQKRYLLKKSNKFYPDIENRSHLLRWFCKPSYLFTY